MQVGKGGAREGPGPREGALLSPHPALGSEAPSSSGLLPNFKVLLLVVLGGQWWLWPTPPGLGNWRRSFGGRHALGQLGEEGGPPPLAFLPPVKQRSYLPQPLTLPPPPLRGLTENWEAWSFARSRPRRNQRSLPEQLRGETYCCWGWGGGGEWFAGLQREKEGFLPRTNEDAHPGKLITLYSKDYITSFWVFL